MTNDEIKSTLSEWNRRVTRATWCHHQAATRLRRFHCGIGIPLVIMTTIVGALTGSDFGCPKIAISALSVIAAILAGLQTFLNFAERAESHRKVGSAYSTLRREIEHLALFPPKAEKELQEHFAKIRRQMDKVADQCPIIPNDIWQKAEKKYGKATYNLPVRSVEEPDRA